MADTRFMLQPYGFKFCIKRYLYEIKQLRYDGMPAQELQQLKRYYSAVQAFESSNLLQLATFIITYARPSTQHAQKLHQAMDYMLGDEVVHPNMADYRYLLLLKSYAETFRHHMHHIRDWVIRAALTGSMSPVAPHVDRAIESTLNAIDGKLAMYKNILKIT